MITDQSEGQKEISAVLNGEETWLLANRSYRSGVNKCGKEWCSYVVSNMKDQQM